MPSARVRRERHFTESSVLYKAGRVFDCRPRVPAFENEAARKAAAQSDAFYLTGFACTESGAGRQRLEAGGTRQVESGAGKQGRLVAGGHETRVVWGRKARPRDGGGGGARDPCVLGQEGKAS
ncbi:hypothetical protein NDU88_000987 [Pleurodeles waltl]|uniref:Uncharacterized protein n=1 Tax=Pleurodeles waltl TaxID=8319 RepID=A0AAV7LZR6_PLEWA|nr:hypothetical protein NDU88_000987 [Pleurodeles waltl]